MKIAVVSDSHDNVANIKKAIHLIKKEKIKTILHCGDVCSFDTLKNCFFDFKGKVYVALGNADYISERDNEKLPDNIEILGKVGSIEIKEKKISFCHFPKVAYDLAGTGKYDTVFYGHTHKPWEEEVNQTKLVNPGNLAGIICKSTFATYNIKSGKLELKILENLN